MMKKFLVLAVVLVVAVGSQAVTFSFVGPSELTVGQTAVFKITVSEPIGSFDLDFGLSNVLASISSTPIIIATGRDSGYDGVDSDYSQYGGYEVIGAAGVGGSMSGDLVSFEVTAGPEVGTFSFIGEDYYTTAVSGAAVSTEILFGSFNIVPVPEPITVALLGLGGLFIRRKGF